MLSAKPWKASNALLVCAISFMGIGFVGIIWAAGQKMSGQTDLDRGSILYLLLVTLSMHAPILLGTAAVLLVYRIRWGEAFGFSSPGQGRAVLWGVFAALIFLPISVATHWGSLVAIEWADKKFGLHIDVGKTQEAVAVLSTQQTLAAKIYAAFFAIAIAPVAEEILFRGILYPAIKQAGYPRLALWGTALAFAFIHFDIRIFLPLTILGLIQVFLYERTDTLVAPIAAHSLFNAINVVGVYSEDIGNFFLRLFHHQT